MIAIATSHQGKLTKPKYQVGSGRTQPLGATPDQGGVNFSLYSAHASSVELLLFDKHDDPQPTQVIELDPKTNKTFYYWHIYVKGLKPGSAYAYRVDGPQDVHGAGHTL